MPLGPGSVSPSDSLIGPIVAQLVVVAQQISGIGTCYSEAPDHAPEDNSVLFPLRDWRVLDDTNGKLKVELYFDVIHLFIRQDLPYALATAQTFVMPWFTVLTAYGNNELGGLVISMSLLNKPGKLTGFEWARTPYLAIVNTVCVLTEFNINQS